VKVRSRRVLLIDPKGFGAGLNLGLGYLSAALLKNNYQVKVVDCNNTPERLSQGPRFNLGISKPQHWRKKIDRGLAWKPEVIGISINSFTLDNALKIIMYCRGKAKHPVVYIAGGPHITVVQKNFMERYGYLFDFAVVVGGEETIIDLLKNIDNPQRVKGIIYWDEKKDQVIQMEIRPLIADLDSLPFPNFETFDTVNPKEGLFNYQMISSRGCPYQCVFCCQLWTRRWRARSPKNILAEIKFAVEKYNIRSLTFWDDNFTLDLNRAKEICDLLIAEKLDLEYGLAGVRADRIDEELISKLKESGCTSICMGIEDGDPKTFPLVKKGETLAEIERAAKLIKKYDISLLAYMITGLIGSSYESFLHSLEFIEKLGVPAHWSVAFPFSNTALFAWVRKNGRFLMTLEEGFKQSMTSKNPPVVFDTALYPKEERIKAFNLGNLRSKSYDMVVSSQNNNVFRQALDITEAIWKYDRQKIGWHFYNLLNLFLKSMKHFGRVRMTL